MKKLSKDTMQWLQGSLERNGPNLVTSSFLISIVSPSYLKDPICMMQIGLAVMLDKPIAIVAIKGVEVPPGLIKIAKVIEYVEKGNKEDLNRACESIRDYIKTLHPEGPCQTPNL